MKKIVDGNNACSSIAYLFSEVCSIYPITPASPMASNIDHLIENKKLNLYNDLPRIIEMQSEAGAAGALHGALLSGSLASTFTSSQGLLLMIPNMYKIAGEMLPAVIHVAARSLATHALSIFGDHQDIYAVRQTGFCMLSSSNVQDAQNLAAVAHLSAIKGSLPFLHFFDGFRTSHEINTINDVDEVELLKLIDKDALKRFKKRSLNVNCNVQYGMAQNEDIYFQCTEARNSDYLNMPDIVNDYMQSINKITGSNYKPFNYFGDELATNVIVAMGSVTSTIKEVVKKLKNVGVVEVHLYRPFSEKYLKNVLPKSVKNIAVLDRTKEAGSIGEPLYLDVVAALKDTNINIVGGRYGLSSKNIDPSDIYSVYKMLDNKLQNNFTIGIEDDVTNLSLKKYHLDLEDKESQIKVYGFGSDGMVSASKDLLKIINKYNDSFVQGYFEYDSKKSGGVTVSHLRIGNEVIDKPYYVEKPNIVVVTKDMYFHKYNLIDDIKNNGILLINTTRGEKINSFLPNKVKSIINKKKIKVFYIDADNIAKKHQLNGKISKIMESLIINLLNINDALDILKDNIKVDYKLKGSEVIDNNILAINDALSLVKEINLESSDNLTIEVKPSNVDDMINHRLGYELKVSDLLDYRNGSYKAGNTKKEKRNLSNIVPVWNKENCINCGMCSILCPHAVIRSVNNKGEYEIVISEADCTGCSICASICPGKMGKKALEMQEKTNKNKDVNFDKYDYKRYLDKFTIKDSQLQKPLFCFSGACAGCGETPYIKLLTQLFGEKIVIANATGCSSIYGGSTPSTPYSIPWANSLFEDNAEFALGIHLSYKQKRDRIASIMESALASVDNDVKVLFEKFLANKEDVKITTEVKEALEGKLIPKELKELSDYIPARTVWAVGGDGWAYDIGFGGIDHVIHSNENIKMLVLDTEVYSNTGGQMSKSTKLGAVAEFANLGKKTAKKDLFKIASSIPNCYVASICLGANMMQAIKAFEEADKHNGPAIIIAYSPCVEHGIKSGMSNASIEQKLAVECGYTLLMRYDNELILDSKEPDFSKYESFLDNEVRFNALKIKDKKLASVLLNEQKQNAINRYNYYKNLKVNN